MKNLRHLDLKNNKIEDINILGDLDINLISYLDLGSNFITDIKVLKSMSL